LRALRFEPGQGQVNLLCGTFNELKDCRINNRHDEHIQLNSITPWELSEVGQLKKIAEPEVNGKSIQMKSKITHLFKTQLFSCQEFYNIIKLLN
jgi:hypothetical protein